VFDWLHRLVGSSWAVLVEICRDYTFIVDIHIIGLGFSRPFGFCSPVVRCAFVGYSVEENGRFACISALWVARNFTG
jgi:hypothetical protein